MQQQKDNAHLTPEEIVRELNKHIVGQGAAKRAVAVALRNRWRRAKVDGELRHEIKPKNIFLIGPTGVGKTEIARRLATLVNAPFIKVEATKFTEVGYVGRDVESIIRDLIESAIKQTREEDMKRVKFKAENAAMERILDALLPKPIIKSSSNYQEKNEVSSSNTRQLFKEKLLAGEFDNRIIELDMAVPNIGVEIMAPPGMEEMTSQLQSMLSSIGSGKVRRRKIKVKNAMKQLCDEEAAAMINEEESKHVAKERVEQNGIVFIDEIDKITQRTGTSGADVSREGVQRDLLPLVEGTTVFTKYGMIRTDHILFIASGAFHLSKPSDLIPELQGRFPIRVELDALTADDFVKILTEPKASLVEQYIALMATEGVNLKFEKDAINTMAKIAFQVNEMTDNIGARRLYTIMERLLEDISYSSPSRRGESFVIDAAYVDSQLSPLLRNEDLTKYIL